MICSVGIDLHQGQHRARCLDERAQSCDSFSFQTTPEGLATLEERVFQDGANPTVVLEPAGLPWLMTILEGEPCPGLFVMKPGAVKLYRNSPEGEEQIMRIIHRGGCFECAPLFDKGPNPVSAQALEACRVLLIPASDFWSIVSAQPQVVLGIVAILPVRLRSLLNMVEDFSFRRVHSRLAKLLLQLSEEDGGGLAVSPSQPLNQQQLACILGCSRQVVNHSLRELIKGGIIRMEGRRIIVLKPEALRRIS